MSATNISAIRISKVACHRSRCPASCLPRPPGRRTPGSERSRGRGGETRGHSSELRLRTPDARCCAPPSRVALGSSDAPARPASDEPEQGPRSRGGGFTRDPRTRLRSPQLPSAGRSLPRGPGGVETGLCQTLPTKPQLRATRRLGTPRPRRDVGSG